MKKNLFFLFLLLNTFCICSHAQNLVPNPSFEQKAFCPNKVHTIVCTAWDSTISPPDCIAEKASSSYFDSMLIGWSSYRETPNYFNSCATFWEVGVPYNIFGRQAAYDGHAYVGITTYSIDNIGYQFTEVVGAQLSLPMISGTKYFVSAYVNRAKGYNNGAANNNLGFKFSTVAYSQHDSIQVDNYAQVRDTSIITDSINWTKISGSFVADSGYQYVAIGNFYDNNHTDTVDVNHDGLSFILAYYYIDQVCVSSDSLTCNIIDGINSVEKDYLVKLFPNPFDNQLTITSEGKELMEIIIYDVSMRKIYTQKFSNATTINTQHLESGIYFYELVDNRPTIKEKGKLIKR